MALTPQSTAELERTDSEAEILAGAASAVANELGKLIENFGGPSELPTATRTALEQAKGAVNSIDRTQSIGDAMAHIFADLSTNVQSATPTRVGLMTATQVQTLDSAAVGEEYVPLYAGGRLTF